MATTRLNKKQQAIARLFIEDVLLEPGLFEDNPALARDTLSFCYTMLGYQILPNGHAIEIGKEVKTKYGAGLTGDAYDEYDDQYLPDGRALGNVALRYSPSSSK